MKSLVHPVLIAIALSISGASWAQDESLSKNFGFGFHLKQNQRDFGIGLNITSPYFAAKRVAIRLRGNALFHEHLDQQNETTWTPYSNLSLGVVSVAGEVLNAIRIYAEGGSAVLFPSGEFSAETANFGGYGLFGFEFFMNPHSNYFLEIGGIGTGASADKIEGQPIYSNGLLINVGYRCQF